MGMSYWIEAIEPPLDVEAIHARVRALPCVVERVRGDRHEYVLAGDRRTERQIRAGEPLRSEPPLFGVEDGAVWLGLRWSDNHYDHGAHLVHWVLDNHRCRGVEGDWGTKLDDNEAIRRELQRWSICPVLSPEARRQRVGELLTGRLLRAIGCDGLDVSLRFTAGEGEDRVLAAPLERCVIAPADPRTEGLEPDERTLVGLHRMTLCSVKDVRWDHDGALSLVIDGGDTVRFAAEWPENEDGWRLVDAADRLLAEAGNGGALRVP